MRILAVSENGDPVYEPLHAWLDGRDVTTRRVRLSELRRDASPMFGDKIGRYFPPRVTIRALSHEIDVFGPDMIHVGAGRPSVLATLRAVSGKPDISLLMSHGAIGGLNVFSPLEWATFFNRRVGAIVVPSRALVNNWMASPLLRRAISPARCAVLRHAIASSATPSQSREELRAELGLDESEFVVGTVCHIRSVKNLAFAADVVKRVGGNAIFAVVGGSANKPEVDRVRKAGGAHVRIIGPVPGARRIMPAFDIFVTPTRLPGESFGLAPAEAMSQGVPVLTMEHGGTAEIIETGVSGLALPAARTHWIEAIRSLRSDPARRSRMGQAARTRILDQFSVEAVARDYLDLCRRVATR